MLIVDTKQHRVVDLMQPTAAMQQFWQTLLKHFGGIGGRGQNALLALMQKIVILLKHPSIIYRLLRYTFSILKNESDRLKLFKSAMQGDVGAYQNCDA